MPVDVAAYLLNEKRQAVLKLEQRHNVQLLIIPNTRLETPRTLKCLVSVQAKK